jgi:hypothetical protein
MATKAVKNRIADLTNGEKEPKGEKLTISAPKFRTVHIRIIGTSPYCQNKFSAKARQQMKEKQESGTQGNTRKKRDPKDFDACYKAAMHVSHEGWYGLPASAFRTAMIDACRLVNFKMTFAKLGVFVEPDGRDADDGTPLVRITKGEPEYYESCVKNDSGVADVRARPLWKEGWEAIVRVRFDEDMFSLNDITNLMHRVGQQVGIGEGRPNSRDSCGIGFGLFEVEQYK